MEILKISQPFPLGERRERPVANLAQAPQTVETQKDPKNETTGENVDFRIILPLAVNIGTLLNTQELGHFPTTVGIIAANIVAFGTGTLLDLKKNKGKRN